MKAIEAAEDFQIVFPGLAESDARIKNEMRFVPAGFDEHFRTLFKKSEKFVP